MSDPLWYIIVGGAGYILDKAMGSIVGEYVKRMWFKHVHGPAVSEREITIQNLEEAEQRFAESELVLLRVRKKAEALISENQRLKARIAYLESENSQHLNGAASPAPLPPTTDGAETLPN